MVVIWKCAVPPISVPDSGDTGEGGMIIQLVKRSLGVKDLAAMYVLVFLITQGSSYLNSCPLGVSHCRLRCWSLFQISNTGITQIDRLSLQRTLDFS